MEDGRWTMCAQTFSGGTCPALLRPSKHVHYFYLAYAPGPYNTGFLGSAITSPTLELGVHVSQSFC